MTKIIAKNGEVEELSSKTTAERYENKWKKIQLKLIELYQNIPDEEQYLFDKKIFFQELKNQYELLLHSRIFNFIFVRNHAKLHWLKENLNQCDIHFLQDFNK